MAHAPTKTAVSRIPFTASSMKKSLEAPPPAFNPAGAPLAGADEEEDEGVCGVRSPAEGDPAAAPAAADEGWLSPSRARLRQ